jgi:hypothetical protein
MYKPSTYLLSGYLFYYISTYIWDLFPIELVTKVKPNINSVEVHPQRSNNMHPMDGAASIQKLFHYYFSILVVRWEWFFLKMWR